MRHYKTMKIFIMLVLMLSMLFGAALPAYAALGDAELKPANKEYEDGNIVLHKQAERIGPDEWEIEVSATVGEEPVAKQKIEVTIVLDRSGSMNYCTDNDQHQNAEDHRHTEECYSYTFNCDKTEHIHSIANNCYGDLDCDKAENHTHTDECYNWTCDKVENHEHTVADCYVLNCNKTNHTHSLPDCYGEECTRESNPDHWSWFFGYYHNNDNCEQIDGSYYPLTCTLENHTHSVANGCYTLTCTLEANHTHSEENGCYEVVCGEEENHTHSVANGCYPLICTQEEHVHTQADCYDSELICKLDPGSQHPTSTGNVCRHSDGTAYPTRFAAAKTAISTLVDGLPEEVELHDYVVFSSNNNSNTYTTGSLANVTASGATYLMRGVDLGIDQFTSGATKVEGVQKVLIIVADGVSENGYTSTKYENFVNNGGVVHTVGFMFSDSRFENMAANGGKFVHADNTESLITSMEQLQKTITAMLEDPMGTGVGFDADSITEITSTSGSVTSSGDTIYWNPDSDETNVSDTTIAYKYTVKLNSNADLSAGTHVDMDLNSPTYFRYGLLDDGVVTQMKEAQFPIPAADYALSSVQVKWQCDGADIPVVGYEPTEVEKVISDYSNNGSDGYHKAYTPTYTTDYTTITPVIRTAAGDEYRYIGTTTTVTDPATNSTTTYDGSGVVKASNAVQHVVVHNYVLVAAGETVIPGVKKLEGREFIAGDTFSYTLKPITVGAPMPENAVNGVSTVTISPAKGTSVDFAFEKIKYTASGTYQYKIAEVIPADADKIDRVIYDTTEHTVTVTVTDVNNRRIVTVNPASVTFTNRYPTKGNLQLIKDLNSNAPLEATSFTFEITSDLPEDEWEALQEWAAAHSSIASYNNGALTVTIEGVTTGDNGTVLLEGLPAANYTVTEEVDAEKYDVTYAPAGGVVTVAPSETAVVTVTNTAKVGALAVKKTVVAPNTYANKRFTFEVRDEAGNIVPTGSFMLTHDETASINLPAGDYTITEVFEEPGWTTTPSLVQTATVTAGEETRVEFTNTYDPTPAKQTLAATKVMTGRDLVAGEFSFVLKDAEGKEIETVPNAADGSVSFAELTFDMPGTYTYTISEVVPEGYTAGTRVNGVAYDIHTVTATITVTDTNGVLTAAVAYEGETTFKNSYAVQPTTMSEKLQVTKQLVSNTTNRKLEEGEFSFVLSDGTTEQTKTNAADGTVLFDALTFNAAGEYTYTISEVIPTDQLPGMTYAHNTVKVTIKVKDNGDGTLSIDSFTYDPAKVDGKADFTNRYEVTANAKATISATKKIKGRDFQTGDAFGFTLAPVTTGAPMPSTATVEIDPTSGDSQSFTFGEIEFTKEGSYQYAITEDKPSPGIGGVTYDTHTEYVTVNVTVDAATGALVANVVYDDDSALFVNAYDADGEWPPTFEKTLTGRDLADGEFSFEIYETTGDKMQLLETITNQTIDGKGGQVDFTQITYEEPGTFTYLVKEVGGDLPGVTYDTTEFTLTIVLTDDGSGTLQVETKDIKATNGQSAYPVFNNVYNPSADIKFPGTKVLRDQDGNVVPLTEGQFSFKLKDFQTMDESVTVTHKADGKFSFNLHYDLADLGGENFKQFDYAISEVIPSGATEVKNVNIGGDVYTWYMLHEGMYYQDGYKNFAVEVTHDPDKGTLTAVILPESIATSGVQFVNVYDAADVEVTLDGLKTLTGKELAAGDFTFKIEPVGDAPMPDDETAENAAGGSFSFGPILFNKIGTYEYTITETNDAKPGYTYDEASVTVTVVVTDDRGRLNAAVSYEKNGQTADKAEFLNTYDAQDAEVRLSVEKTMEGRTLLSTDTFTFTLECEDGTPMPKNGEDKLTVNGTAGAASVRGSFDTITFDDPGTYVYQVKEVKGSLPGVTYDEDIETITVTVVDNNGVLEATVDPKNATASFTNIYAAKNVEVTIPGTKVLLDRNSKPLTLAGDEFEFMIMGTEGAPAPEADKVRNAANGIFSFGKITFTKPGTYEYQVIENSSSQTGYIYDNTVYIATVTVTDDYATGELKAEVVYTASNPAGTVNETAEKIVFTNTYDADDAQVRLDVQKVMKGRALLKGEVYTFTIEGSKGAPMPVDGDNQPQTQLMLNAAEVATSMSGSFSNITFTDPGTYTYTITENVPDGYVAGTAVNGVAYDTTPKTITVTVEDINGVLTATVTPSNVATFTNVYSTADATAHVSAKKVLEGRDFLETDSFTFELTAGESMPMPEQSSVIIVPAEDGAEKTFGTITFTEPGTYTYTVTETEGDIGGVTYDAEPKTLTFTVTDDGNGKLVVEPATAVAEFTNVYAPKGTVNAQFAVTKVLEGREFKAGDEFTFELLQPESTGTPMPNPAEITVKPTSGERITENFAQITYDAAGEYVYQVKEVKGSLPGVAYDQHIETITVKVEDALDGTYKATVIYDDAVNGAEFTNVYNEVGQWPPVFKKEFVKGGNVQQLQGGKYTFQLRDTTGGKNVLLETVSNDEDGEITFTELIFTEEGTYTHTVTEVLPDGATKVEGKDQYIFNGTTYDAQTVELTITIERNAETGKLFVASKSYNGSLTFTNSYEATGVLDIPGTKKLEGRWLEDDEFSFVIKEGETVIDTVTNKDGEFGFHFDYKLADVGEHVYTISEVVPDPALGGVTYDNTVYTITVTVTDKGDGTLSVTADPADISADFVNVYETQPIQIPVAVTKNLTGRDFAEGDEFAFCLTPVTTGNPPMPEGNGVIEGSIQTVTISPDSGISETVSFGKITITEEGTYEYLISENMPEGGEYADGAYVHEGITYDQATITLKINVVDDGEGKLIPEVTWRESGTENEKTAFNNAYSTTSISRQLAATKVLEGRELEEGEFTFRLTDDNDEIVEEVANAADGKVAFSNIEYTVPGIYTYTISEVKGELGGVTYDEHVATAVVTVEDDGKGKLTATVTYQGGTVFTNTYAITKPTEAVIEVPKTLTGRELVDGEFTFELLDDQDNVIQTVTNAAGKVTFKAIEYTKPGTAAYTYTIREVKGELGGVTYDEGTVTVTVTVTDDGQGTLTSAVTYGDKKGFENVYAITEPTTAQISAHKTLNNRDLEEGEFSFELKNAEGDVIQTKTNDAEGNITFDEIEYGAAGEYTYTITETVGTLPGVVYDHHVGLVTVKVTDNKDGTLSAEVIYGQTASDGNEFVNNYYTVGQFPPPMHKVYVGRDLQAGEFSFELKNAEGDVIDTATNDENGDVQFKTMTYDLPGTYTYTGVEVMPEGAVKVDDNHYYLDGVTYDYHEATLSITVTKNDDGTLSAVVTSIATTFTNVYEATGSITILGTKKLEGRDLADNEFEFVLMEGEKQVGTAVKNVDGKFEFALDYKLADVGTHNYTISEVKGSLPGVTYDESVKNVTVTVTDNQNGTLNVTMSPADFSADFKNTYTPTPIVLPDEQKMAVTKVLVGRPLNPEGGEFSFELKDAQGNVIETVANAADGSVDFSAITYTVGGTYEYTITEVVPDPALGGVTYDTHTVKATITVTDDGLGNLTITGPEYEGETIFKNSYKTGTITAAPFAVTKKLEGRKLAEGEFEFVLREKGAAEVLQTAKNTADGTVTFKPINFAAAGEYHYTITETKGNLGGVKYDDLVVDVTVTVVDNGDGTLSATVSYSEDTEFNNVYTVTETTAKPFEINKKLTGRALKQKEFSFQLKDASGTVLQTKTNTSAGVVTFDEITFDAAGTYTYTINEVKGDLGGVTYDESIVTVTVTVVDNGDGTLTATVAYTNDDNTFENSYKPAEVTAAPITGLKTMIGRELTEGEFEFELKDASGEVIQTVTNAADGSIAFEGITFTEVGEYTYTIVELLPKGVDPADGRFHEGVAYDGYVSKVTFVVTDDGMGQLEAEAVHDLDGVSFVNTYRAEGEFPPEFHKHMWNRELKAGDYSFVLTDEDGNEIETVQNDEDGRIVFKNLHFDAPGVYVYYVSEVIPADADKVPGINYDPDVTKLTMTVTDNGDGTMTMEDSYEGDQYFFNWYSATGSTTIEGTKTLTGRDMNEGEFTFVLHGTTSRATQTTVNSKDGSFSFPLSYTLRDVGTHHYTITETEGEAGGVSYDGTVINVTVTVTDNGDGTLDVKVETDADVAFNNTYKPGATTAEAFKVEKTLDGRTMNAGEFSFELVDASGTVVETVSNAADGTVTFSAIKYEEAGTYTYTIREAAGELGGVSYDDNEVTVTVEVVDNLDGTMTATVEYSGELTFANTYKAGSTTASLAVTKELVGRELAEGEFEFVVTDSEGNEVATATNAADGTVTFEPIEFTEAGEYELTIAEVKGTLGGVAYDTHKATATVTVVDNWDGTLTATVEYAGGTNFVNTYTVEETTADAMVAHKVLTGRDLNAEEFSFELKDSEGNVLETVKNAADGTVTFAPVDFAAAGEYHFTISEVKGDLGGVTYDESTVNVTVTVVDNGDGTLTATVSYANDDNTFENAYNYASVTAAPMQVSKRLVGRDLNAGEFDFVLMDEQGNVLQTVQNTADGTVTFEGVEFTEPGEYSFTIAEVKGDLGGVIYDEHKISVTVVVIDNLKGNLEAEVIYPRANTFINLYGAEGVWPPKFVKELIGRDLKAGEFSFVLTDENGNTIETVSNAADGSISFSGIDYTEAGTYTYTVKEVVPASKIPGVIYDTHEVKVTVEVIDNLDGTMTIVPTYDGNMTFRNIYEAKGKAIITGSKTLTGREMNEGEFTFELIDKNGKTVASAVNTANGSFTLTVEYDLSGVGTNVYTLVEKKGTAGGVDYDDKTFTVKVHVSDNGDATLSVTSECDCTIAFANEYTVSPKAGEALKVTKELTGRELKAGEFTFVLADANGVIQTVTNTAEGEVNFEAIEYTEAGTYTYTITEVKGDLGGVTYDTHEVKVTVEVIDNLDGTMTVTNNYEGDTNFVNIYEVEPTSTVLAVNKVLTGRDLNEGEFFFQLSDGTGLLQQKANALDGTVVFDEIEYTEPGEYLYTIKELVPTDDTKLGGVTYDEHVITVTVTVVDNLDGTMTATPAYDSATTFENVYKAAPVTAEALALTKVLVGRPLNEGEFTFVLLDAEGNVLETVANAADGSAAFTAITYDTAGEYTYTIAEVVPDTKLGGVTYDEHEVKVTVTVVDNLDGTMTATNVCEGAMVFTNIYNTQGEVTLEARKTLSGRALKEGEFSFELKDASGNVIETVGNTADGIVKFQPITYNVAGEHTYTISEVKGELGGVTYDEHVITITVKVEDNLDGTMTITPAYDGDITFANVYEADGDITFSGVKTVLNAEPADDEVFEFVLADENGVEIERVNNVKGAFTFETLTYTEADAGKVYTYTVTESAAEGFQTDSREYVITVTVTDGGQGDLIVEAVITESGEAVETIAFNNVPLSGLTVTKTVVGWVSEKDFNFKLTVTDENDVPLTDVFTVTGADVETISDGGLFKLKHGGVAVISGIPTGAKFAVEELEDRVYTTSINGVVGSKAQGVIAREGNRVDFTNTVNTIDFSVTKEWDGIEGNDIELTLYADGVEMDPQPGYSRDGYVYTFSNLPKYTDEGDLVVYAAKERFMDGYMTIYRNVEPWKDESDMIYNGGTIINRSVIEFSVQKIWSGLSHYHPRPDIELVLYCNGDVIDRPTPKPDKNGWYHYYNLPRFYKGEVAVYYVIEVPMAGYYTIYNGKESATCAYDGQTIENIRPPVTGDRSNLALWTVMAITSAGALLVLRRRRKNV